LLWQDVTQQAVKLSKSLLDLILIAKRSSTSAHLLMLCIASALDAWTKKDVTDTSIYLIIPEHCGWSNTQKQQAALQTS
jgi:hypothetical protein